MPLNLQHFSSSIKKEQPHVSQKEKFLFSITDDLLRCFSTGPNPCSRMSCDFMCLLNPTGARCTCPEGKVLVNGTCNDVNVSGILTVILTITMSSFLERHDVFSEHTGDNCILCVLLSHISSITLLNITWLCTWRCSKWYKLCRCEGELCRPPCENGGRCLANEKGDWRCYCWPDFSGERCEVNHCTDYCLNGGTCMGSPLGTSVLSKTLYCMIPLDDSHVWRVSESLHEE